MESMQMRIEISCPSCLKHLRVPSPSQGKRIRCPACKHVFTPADQDAMPSDDAPDEKRKATPWLHAHSSSAAEETDEESTPRAASRRMHRREADAMDENSERPEPKRRSRSSRAKRLIIVLGASALVLALGAAGLIWLGGEDASDVGKPIVQNQKPPDRQDGGPVQEEKPSKVVPVAKLPAASWKTFRSKPGRFQIEFPGLAKVSAEKDPVEGITRIAAEVMFDDIDVGFTVHYWDLGPKGKTPPLEWFYDQMRQGMIQSFPSQPAAAPAVSQALDTPRARVIVPFSVNEAVTRAALGHPRDVAGQPPAIDRVDRNRMRDNWGRPVFKPRSFS
jgi:hypothetical protein